MKCNSFPFTPKGASIFLPSLFLLFVINFPSVISTYVWHTCDNSSTFSNGSTYSTNLNLVISDLFRNAPQSSGFNTSSHGQSPNKVYGLVQCIGNISPLNCSKCVVEANSSIQERCANDIGGRIWLDDCFLRYENSNFISTLDTNGSILVNVNSITGEVFKSTTSRLLSNLSNKAYIPANKGFAAGSANYSASGMLYGSVQCWRDISTQDCRKCLDAATTTLNKCCSTNQGARVLGGSCEVRYETYSFFNSAQAPSPSQSPSPSPQGSTSNTSRTAPPPTIGSSPKTVNETSSTTSKSMSRLSLFLLVGFWGMSWNM